MPGIARAERGEKLIGNCPGAGGQLIRLGGTATKKDLARYYREGLFSPRYDSIRSHLAGLDASKARESAARAAV